MGTRMYGQLNDKINKQVTEKTVNLDFSNGNQVIQETGKLLSKVTVNKSTDFIAENIRSGKTLGNIQGTASTYEDGATANDIKVGKKALVNGVDVDGVVEVNTTTEVPITTNGTHTIEVANKICEEDIIVNVNVPGVVVNTTTTTKEVAKTARNTSLSIQGGKFVNFTHNSGDDLVRASEETTIEPCNYTEVQPGLLVKSYCNTSTGKIILYLYKRTIDGLIVRDVKLDESILYTTLSADKMNVSTSLNVAILGENLFAVPYLYKKTTGSYSYTFNCGLCTFSIENNLLNIIRNDTALFTTNYDASTAWQIHNKKRILVVKNDSSHIGFVLSPGGTYRAYFEYMKGVVTYPETPTVTSQAPIMTIEGVTPVSESYGHYGYHGFHWIDESHFVIEELGTTTTSLKDYIYLVLYKIEGNYNFTLTKLQSMDADYCSASYGTFCHFNKSEDNVFTGLFVKYSSSYYRYFIKISYANETLTKNISIYSSTSNYYSLYSFSNTIHTQNDEYFIATIKESGGEITLWRCYPRTSSTWAIQEYFTSSITSNSIPRPILDYSQSGKFTIIGNNWIDYYKLNNYIIVPSSGATTANGFIAQNGTFTSGQQVLVAIPQ